MTIVKVKPSEISDATAAALAARIRKDVFKNQANVWDYVSEWADLPLGTTDDDPEVGDLVGVNNETGTWILGTLRRRGFYKRVALTGTRAEQYGTSPFTDYSAFDTDIAALQDAIGDEAYTEENYISEDNTIRENLDVLDVTLADKQDTIDSEEVQTLQALVADIRETNVADTQEVTLRTAIRVSGTADDNSLLTEKAVRDALPAVSAEESVTPDTILEITIGGVKYIFQAQAV